MKIYNDNDYSQRLIENFIFDLEDLDDFEVVNKIEYSDVVIVDFGRDLKGVSNKKIILHNFFHAATLSNKDVENFIKNNPNNKIHIVSTFPLDIDVNLFDNVQFDIYDLLFNRTKAYYQQWPFKSLLNQTGIPWYYAGQDSYKINLNLDFNLFNRSKLFIFCARLRKHGESYQHDSRFQIQKAVSRYKDIGYFHVEEYDRRDIPSRSGLFSGQDDDRYNGNLNFDVTTGKIKKHQEDKQCFYKGMDYYRGYSPVHVNYYNDSYLSIVSESIDNAACPTEKTYDALIKGHYVLPFGGPYLVDYLRTQGFFFSDFFNYSYDKQLDLNKRLDMFLAEINRICQMEIHEVGEQYKKDFKFLCENQRLFWQKPLYQFMPILHG